MPEFHWHWYINRFKGCNDDSGKKNSKKRMKEKVSERVHLSGLAFGYKSSSKF